MQPCILFRPEFDSEKEMEIASKYFPVYSSRSKIPSNSLIIPRYSALPYYKELEEDSKTLGSTLINSYQQFQFIADFQYYESIKDYTFKTYFDATDLPKDKAFVVKGKTNSRKGQWNTHCFAKNKQEAIEIAYLLKQDGLIGFQDIIFREYEELVMFEKLINDLPVANEFRFFYMGKICLCHGYYWSNAEHPEYGKLDEIAYALVDKVSEAISAFNNFFVLDIAQKKNGDWILVEINAGEMSGLSLCNPDELYRNMKDALAFSGS